MPRLKWLKWFKSRGFGLLRNNRDLLLRPVVSAILEDIPGGEKNLLASSAWLNPLRVDIPLWQHSNPSPEQPEHLTLYWDDGLVEEKSWEHAIPPDELFVMVPQVRLSEGEHRLRYHVMAYNGEESDSDLLTLIIDKTPPILVNEGPLIFPPEVVSGGVTEQYLKANGDQLLAEIPVYQVPKPGDLITWYWSSSPTGSEVAGTTTLALADIGKPLIVSFSGQIIRDGRDGKRYGFYTVKDRAGNLGQRSLAVELQVAVTPVPRELPPARVKEASGTASSGLLSPANAKNGVTVVIPFAAVIYPGEPVSVQWGEPGSMGAFRTDTPVATDSREYKIPKDCIAPYLGHTLPVSYEVTEAGKVLTSEPHSLRVEELSGLPAIQSDKVSGGKLSLETIVEGGYASFTLGSWSFMATSQYLTIKVEGVDDANQLVSIAVLTEQQVPEVAAIIAVGQISKADLRRFKIGFGIEVKVKVSFDGKQTWKTFPSLTPTLVD
jgi:hypothetical protein